MESCCRFSVSLSPKALAPAGLEQASSARRPTAALVQTKYCMRGATIAQRSPFKPETIAGGCGTLMDPSGATTTTCLQLPISG